MQLFNSGLSSMLCCFGADPSQESRQSSFSPRKAAVSKDTPISMSVHGASVPHAIDSPDALHKIFASNSSTRGYNAIQGRPPKRSAANGSLDLSFQFGPESPKKPRGRLEQLTQHVKQKLSETGLSRSSEQREHEETVPIQLSNTSQQLRADAATQLLSQSQKSVGLSELLASRAVSEGGYDSDARSIQTPTILNGTGILKSDQKCARTSLTTIEATQADERPTMTKSTTASPTYPRRSPEELVSRSSVHVETPAKVGLIDAIQMSPDESPTDVLRRVSNGVTRGNIQIPDTLEVDERYVTSLSHGLAIEDMPVHSSRCVTTATETGIHVNRKNENLDMRQTLRMLAHRVDQARRESLASSGTDSLISELDPALIRYIENFAIPSSSGQILSCSSPVTAIKMSSRQTSSGQLIENVDAPKEVLDSSATSSRRTAEDESATASTDASSPHLFNMHISQRLASASRMDVASSGSDTVGLSAKISMPVYMVGGALQHKASSASRGPTFIAIEPTRRPSDPETKKLFEYPRSKYDRFHELRSFSDGSIDVQCTIMESKQPVPDDSSSYYSSVARKSADEGAEPSLTSRQGSLRNANSLAVGGRSASGSLVRTYTVRGPYRSLSAGEASTQVTHPHSYSQAVAESKFGAQQAVEERSFSMPKSSKFVKVDTTPTPVMRKLYNSTEANEEMSEIGIDRIGGDGDRHSDSDESVQAIEDRRNENFSDMNPEIAKIGLNGKAGIRNAWLSQGRRNGWGYGFKDDSPRKHALNTFRNEECQFKRSPFPSGQGDASEVWCKAFKRLAEPSDFGRLLATPQFDREGRRKLSIRSISDQGGYGADYPCTPVNHRRSQSADLERADIDRGVSVLKQRRRSVPILTTQSSKIPRRKSQTLDRLSKMRKRSLAELQRIATNSMSIDFEVRPPLKDSLGIWGRFASHTRDQRNGPAGPADLVRIHDYGEDCVGYPYEQASTPAARSTVSLELRSRKSRNLLTVTKSKMNRRNTKSMNFALSSAEKARMGRKGLFGKVKRLYKTKNSEIHAYTMTQGHRSSVSTSMPTEYPELESLPGGPLHGNSESGMDGTLEQEPEALLDTISEVTSKRSKSVESYTIPWSKKETQEWSKMYQDCVPSTSKLRSDSSLHIPTADERRVLSLTSVLRDSTVSFEAELKKNTDLAREKLLERLQSSSEGDKGLPMPGSFA